MVKAVCTVKKKVLENISVPEGHFLKDFGIEGDATLCMAPNQVSLLSYDKVKEFNEHLITQVERMGLLVKIWW